MRLIVVEAIRDILTEIVAARWRIYRRMTTLENSKALSANDVDMAKIEWYNAQLRLIEWVEQHQQPPVKPLIDLENEKKGT